MANNHPLSKGREVIRKNSNVFSGDKPRGRMDKASIMKEVYLYLNRNKYFGLEGHHLNGYQLVTTFSINRVVGSNLIANEISNYLNSAPVEDFKFSDHTDRRAYHFEIFCKDKVVFQNFFHETLSDVKLINNACRETVSSDSLLNQVANL